MIDISELKKGDVLRALYNFSKPQGMGFLQFDPEEMSKEAADKILADNNGHTYFDYLMGRVMKVEIGKDELDPRLYDRDNGEGAAERAINSVR